MYWRDHALLLPLVSACVCAWQGLESLHSERLLHAVADGVVQPADSKLLAVDGAGADSEVSEVRMHLRHDAVWRCPCDVALRCTCRRPFGARWKSLLVDEAAAARPLSSPLVRFVYRYFCCPSFDAGKWPLPLLPGSCCNRRCLRLFLDVLCVRALLFPQLLVHLRDAARSELWDRAAETLQVWDASGSDVHPSASAEVALVRTAVTIAATYSAAAACLNAVQVCSCALCGGSCG